MATFLDWLLGRPGPDASAPAEPADAADPMGPFGRLLDDDPHSYLTLLGMVDAGGPLARVREIARGREAASYIEAFLQGADWRPHVFAAAAAPMTRRPERFVEPLWRAFDHGSWASPQLAASLWCVDPGFGAAAWSRAEALCPVALHPEWSDPADAEGDDAEDDDAGSTIEQSAKNLAALLGLLENDPAMASRVAAYRETPEVRRVLGHARDDGDFLAVLWLERFLPELERLGFRPPPLRPADRFRRGTDPALGLFERITAGGLAGLEVGEHETESAEAVVSLSDGVFEIVARPREAPGAGVGPSYRALWTGPRADRPRGWPDDMPFLPGRECRIDNPPSLYDLAASWPIATYDRAALRDRVLDLVPEAGSPGAVRAALDALRDATASADVDADTLEIAAWLAEDLEARIADGQAPEEYDVRWLAFWQALHCAGISKGDRSRLWDEANRIVTRQMRTGWTLARHDVSASEHGYRTQADLVRGDEKRCYMLAIQFGAASFTRYGGGAPAASADRRAGTGGALGSAAE